MSTTTHNFTPVTTNDAPPPATSNGKPPERSTSTVQDAIKLASMQAAAAVALQYQPVAKSLGDVGDSLGRLVAYASTDRRELLEEIHRLREDATARAICTPLLFDLCQLAKESWSARVELEQLHASKARDAALTRFENLYASAIESLSRYGIAEFTVNAGEKLDPVRCEPRRAHCPTTKHELVNVIAEVLSPGFGRGTEIIARATVVVFGIDPTHTKEKTP